MSEKNAEMKRARQEGNNPKQQALQAEIQVLKDAEVWPNGDKAAFVFLFVIVSLYLVALTPAVIVVAIVVGRKAFGNG